MQSLEELRKTIILSPTEDLQKRRKPHLPSDDNPNYTYGLETKYSVPVGRIISYHYQREWENMIIEGIYEKKKKEYEEKMKNASNEQETVVTENTECATSSKPEDQKAEGECSNTENETSTQPSDINISHCHDAEEKMKELESKGYHPCTCKD